MDDQPFKYLTQEQFLALSDDERVAYLNRVNDHLADRVASLARKALDKQS